MRAIRSVLVRGLLLSLLGTTVAHAEGINLGWDDCGSAGTELNTFACNSNSVQLFQDPVHGFDPELYSPLARNFVYWQGAPNNCPLSTPVLASVVTTDVEPGLVRIVWSVGEASGATVYRGDGHGGWQRLAYLTADGSRRVTYEDHDVRQGASYDYRIGVTINGYERVAGETTVAVPAAAQLALTAARFDAAAGGLTMSFALPRSEPARLEVFDLTGRRWAADRLDHPDAGPQHFTIAAPRGMASGVYFARLSQGRASASRRFVVYR